MEEKMRVFIAHAHRSIVMSHVCKIPGFSRTGKSHVVEYIKRALDEDTEMRFSTRGPRRVALEMPREDYKALGLILGYALGLSIKNPRSQMFPLILAFMTKYKQASPEFL